MDETDVPLVFVVGDPIIDRYIEGEVTHIAPDAPVSVFREHGCYDKLGGMWNAALNVRGAGIDPVIFNVIGPEADSRRLQSSEFDPEHTFSLELEHWTTQRKIRYLAQYSQQVWRSDIPKNKPLTTEQTDKLVRIMGRASLGYGRKPDVVLVCDYGCGVVSETLITALHAKFGSATIIVDPYPSTPPSWYRGATMLKLNTKEFELLDEREFRASGTHLVDWVPVLVVTDGGGNVKATTQDGNSYSISPPPRDLIDPCGAGDAFVAFLSVAMALGRDLRDALIEAAHAGACAVSHKGVVVVKRDEVVRSIAEQV